MASTDGVFKSKARDTDEKFSFTFSKAGTYPYYCSINSKVTGQIVVRRGDGCLLIDAQQHQGPAFDLYITLL